jgi:hypothetical protein
MVNWWIKYSRQSIPNPNDRLNALNINAPKPNGSLSGMEAAINSVLEIVRTREAPYTLLVSGGVDSQVMMLAWQFSGVNFKIVHYSYNGMNDFDTETLIEFCAKHNLPFTIKNFDARSFIDSPELIEYAKRYDCSSPQILTYIKLAEQHTETVIMSGNSINREHCGLNYTILALDRFANMNKNNFIPFFLLYSPELAYAFYDGDMKFRVKYIKEHGTINAYFAKCESYREQGFDIVCQDKKFTGFENIKDEFDNIQVSNIIKMKYRNFASKRTFDFLFRYSLYEHINLYTEQTVINM